MKENRYGKGKEYIRRKQIRYLSEKWRWILNGKRHGKGKENN